MIRHRPFGGGDPYRVDPDQRMPPVPAAGEPFSVGALASRAVTEVVLEWSVDGETRRLPARRVGEVAADGSWDPGSGHLAAAAARTRRRGVVWEVSPPPLSYGVVARYRFVAGQDDPRERTAWHHVSAARWQRDRGELRIDGDRRHVVPDSPTWFADGTRVYRARFALVLEPGARVAGFGERFDRVDQRGHRIDAVVFEQYKDQGATGRTYLPVPFAHVIGAGWGFHVRTTRRVWFDIGESEPDKLWIEVDTGGVTAPVVETALYEGTPAQVLDAFLAETGRPELLPAWVHRLWISGNEWNTRDMVMERADRHAAEEIPYGVVVIEAWSDESTFCLFRDARYEVREDGSPHRLADLTHPPGGAWPDPKGMVDELHARGVKVLLWQIPLQKMHPAPRGQAAADARRMIRDGYGIREADGRPYRNRGWWFPKALMPDFTHPEARAWWQAKRRYLVEEVGVDGFKTDGGEHAWGHDLRYHDGTDGSVSNNRFPVHYARTYHDLLAGAGRAPVTFGRAGHTGAQAYGCYWAGDENSTWPAFRNSIVAGITAGLSGITYWGFDLGGFSGEIPDPELYLRSAQAACFMPIMQYHSEFNFRRVPSRDRTPWNIAERHGRPDVLTEFRRWARARELLVPYLHEQAAEGIAAGLPLMRAMALQVPADELVRAYPLQFFLGADLLVAPVTEPGATSIEAYLPAGDWVDLCGGEAHASGTLVRPTPLRDVAVFVRRAAWPRFATLHEALR